MGEFLRNIGISESGIDGPALIVLMAVFACLIVHSQLYNRDPKASRVILILIYLVVFALSIALTWLVWQIENDNARYVLAAVYIAALTFGARLLGRKLLGVRDQVTPDSPKQ